MMRFLYLPLTLLFIYSAACAANGTDRGTASPAAVETGLDYNSLVARLREGGLRVEPADEVQQPFFSPRARVIRINDEEAQVYEYGSEQSAASEASRVSPNGSIGGSMPMWIAPPHFFRKGRLIVLYLGSDPGALGRVREILGPELAGGNNIRSGNNNPGPRDFLAQTPRMSSRARGGVRGEGPRKLRSCLAIPRILGVDAEDRAAERASPSRADAELMMLPAP